jgi:hypothetical protein
LTTEVNKQTIAEESEFLETLKPSPKLNPTEVNSEDLLFTRWNIHDASSSL